MRCFHSLISGTSPDLHTVGDHGYGKPHGSLCPNQHNQSTCVSSTQITTTTTTTTAAAAAAATTTTCVPEKEPPFSSFVASTFPVSFGGTTSGMQPNNSSPTRPSRKFRSLQDSDLSSSCLTAPGLHSSPPESTAQSSAFEVPKQSDSKQPDATEPNSVTLPFLDTSLRTRDGMYKCRVCKRLFPSRFSLTGHYKAHYNATQKPYMCEDCGQRYTSPSNLHYHRARTCAVVKLKINQEMALHPETGTVAGADTATQLKAIMAKQIRNRRQNPVARNAKRSNPSNLCQTPDSCTLKTTQTTQTSSPVSISPSKPVPIFTGSGVFTVPSKIRTRRPVSGTEEGPHSTPSLYSALHNGARNSNESLLENASFHETRQSYENAANLQAQIKQVMEEACQSDELRQKLLNLTSAAIVSALGPSAPDGSRHMQSFMNELIRLTRTAETESAHPNRSAICSSSTESHQPHPPATTRSDNRLIYPSSSNAESEYAPRFACPHCPANVALFRDHLTLKNHILHFHMERSDPCTPWFARDVKENTGDSQITLEQHLNALLPNSFTPIPTSSDSATNRSTRPRLTNRARGAASAVHARTSHSRSPVQCPECGRYFSSQTACRVHFTKIHQNHSTSARGIAIERETREIDRTTNKDLAGKTLVQTDWREMCPQ